MGENRICKLLGIQYPIIQAPMNWVSGAALTGAVSRAGGLGTIGPNAGAESISADVETTGKRLRNQIKNVRNITEKPFAVNIPIGFGDDRKFSKRCVEVIIEEKVPVAVISVGQPDVYTEVLKEAGITVLHAISTPRHAVKAEKAGVDGVICEGFEAGGHKGFTELTTLALTPMVADAVTIPIITGGGIADARGVLSALALGADAVYLGTRFMATKESDSHIRVKDAIIRGKDACTVSLPKDIMLVRDLNNAFTKEYMDKKRAGASDETLRNFISEHSQYHAQHLGEAEDAEICCGQGAGLISEILSAEEVVKGIADNIFSRFEDLKARIDSFT